MTDIIKHPFCQRRHPNFPPDSLYLMPGPELASMKAEVEKHNGLETSALKKLRVLLPNSTEEELTEALLAPE